MGQLTTGGGGGGGECNVFLCVQPSYHLHYQWQSCLLVGDNVSFLAYKQPLIAFQIATESHLLV